MIPETEFELTNWGIEDLLDAFTQRKLLISDGVPDNWYTMGLGLSLGKKVLRAVHYNSPLVGMGETVLRHRWLSDEFFHYEIEAGEPRLTYMYCAFRPGQQGVQWVYDVVSDLITIKEPSQDDLLPLSAVFDHAAFSQWVLRSKKATYVKEAAEFVYQCKRYRFPVTIITKGN